MKTKVITIDKNNVNTGELEEAAEVLSTGGLVAFPTETVYGLGGDATSPEASRKIYEAKGRPSDNPLIVHIADFSQLEQIALEVPQEARQLAEAFWPGPLTMIVKKNDVIPLETTGGLDTVAVRMPNHPVALEFIRKSGCMIAAPSANTSGRPSPTKASHVYEDLNGRIDMIIDGGAVGIGIESTIVDLTEETPMILRPGYITPEMLEEVVGEVKMDPGIIREDTKVRPKAPGMRYKHYAPKGNLILVDGEKTQVIDKINQLATVDTAAGKKVGIIGTRETLDRYHEGIVLSIGERSDEDSIARHLYDILRQFDDLEVEVIYSESFATPRIGQAIMNRLLKAAGHQVIEV